MQKFSNKIFTVDNFTESSEKFTGRLCGIVVKVVRLCVNVNIICVARHTGQTYIQKLL